MRRSWIVFLVLLTLAIAGCKRTESETTTASADTASDTATATTEATDTSATAGVPSNDPSFATVASMANLYEIESGKLAEQKASGARYKEFAQTMVRQHQEIGDSYKPIAEKQGLPMPSALADLPGNEFKSMYDTLVSTPAGPSFDRTYKQQMVTTHTGAKTLFGTESASGQDPELKAFAARWLPTVEHHLQMANELPDPQ